VTFKIEVKLMKHKIATALVLSLFSVNALATKYANAEAHVDSANTYINTSHNVVGEFEYGIQNNTSATQKYRVTYQLCAENKGCISETIPINLSSGQRVQKKFKTEMMVSYRHTGVYRLTANLNIDGESKSDKTDYGTLSVYNK
jgi:hypothetical protein